MTDRMSMDRSHLIPRTTLLKLHSVYLSLKKAERSAADYLLEHAEAIAAHTIVELKTLSGSSETTWFRLAKRLGYTGFQEMKKDITEHLENLKEIDEQPLQIYEDIDESNSPMEVAAKVFESSITALRDTCEILHPDQYNQAVEVLLKADSVVLCGVGDAYSVARSAYQRFYRAGIKVHMNADQDLQLIAINQMRKGDAMIVISYSGRTKTVLDLVKYARSRKITVIAITNFPSSPLTKHSDIVLQTAAFTMHTNGEIASKRITQLCVVESLYVNLLLRSEKKLGEAVRGSSEAIGLNKL